ncbi:MAG: hypothetical protein LJF30_23450 [Acidobacteria bacterium]|nr:hypothetical protein [Acidobacteriota bacterium]
MKSRAWVVVTGLGILFLGIGLAAPGWAETRRIAPNPGYEAGALHRFWLGTGYRDLWTTPIELEVLDLEKEAGGLTVFRQVGGMQTPGLAFTGADGRSYTFRWIDKDPSRLLPEEWRQTVVAEYVKDQTAASHPGNWPVLMGLAEAIGIVPFTPQRLMVMPDDPALGEHRELFAGSVGSFGEYPMPAHDGVPGFMGATEIISSKELWDRWRESPKNRIDSQVFVRERIVNLWTGNWDRHRSQWRWAWVPDRGLWVPIPEDPDQAFSDYGGLLISVARWTVPILLKFGDEISGMEGAVHNGADVDRWLLSDLGRDDFAKAAQHVQSLLTDEVIDAAVRRLPPEWYALNGELLAHRLKSRRDDIPEATARYYDFLAGEVNVHATNADEVARIRRFDDGAVEVTVAPDGASAEPYFRRRFHPEETKSVRVYLHGGNDRVLSEGPATGRITVQVLGGTGDDTLDDSRSGKTRFDDFEGTNEVRKGPGTKVDERPWKNPRPDENAPWFEPRDYNRVWLGNALLWWEPDLGIYAGGGITRRSYGFRKYPFANAHHLSFGYATKRKAFRFEYHGSFRRKNSNLFAEVRGLASGIDRLHFFGFGNETPDIGDRNIYSVNQTLYRITPTVNWSSGKEFEILVGVGVQFSQEKDENSLIDLLRPYGWGDFGQLNLVTALEWDSRGRKAGGMQAMMTGETQLEDGGARRRYTGLRVVGGGQYSPGVWDLEEPFGGVQGSVSGYLGLGPTERVVLAARVGGRQTIGDYPWYAAAFIGGADNNRGYREQRFAGDRSLYGNLEVRLRAIDRMPVFPGRLWLVALGDVGRVWLEGEDSDDWHPSYGGGIAFEVAGAPVTFWGGAVKGEGTEGLRWYFGSGFGF